MKVYGRAIETQIRAIFDVSGKRPQAIGKTGASETPQIVVKLETPPRFQSFQSIEERSGKRTFFIKVFNRGIFFNTAKERAKPSLS